MFEPVKIELWSEGVMLREFVAHRPDELKCRIELMTGIAWLDVREQYMALRAMRLRQLSHSWQVCHSYEKWGGWQQEVADIEVRMQRVTIKREDLRAEWYRECYLAETAYAGWIPRPPRIYWLGMLLSVIWLLAYLAIYPSIPLVSAQTHWKGFGVPGGCQPWTAICEMQRSESVLHEVRGKYWQRIRTMSLADLADDAEMVEFIMRAGRVRFADHCGKCHIGQLYGGDKLAGGKAPISLARLHTGSAHSVAAYFDETTAKIMAVYAYRLSRPDWASISARRP